MIVSVLIALRSMIVLSFAVPVGCCLPSACYLAWDVSASSGSLLPSAASPGPIWAGS
jgi:hypothetical protein